MTEQTVLPSKQTTELLVGVCLEVHQARTPVLPYSRHPSFPYARTPVYCARDHDDKRARLGRRERPMTTLSKAAGAGLAPLGEHSCSGAPA